MNRSISFPDCIRVVDSHTEGEPTRVVVEGAPALPGVTLAEKAAALSDELDFVRRAIVNEPRGSDILVGALLVEPSAPECVAGLIFFNNVGLLGMCGHATIGAVETLAYLGRIQTGVCLVETPVGIVRAERTREGTVRVRNVASFRYRHDIAVETERHGTVTGDVAWGGNWFFIVEQPDIAIGLETVAQLQDLTIDIRRSLERTGVRGRDNAVIDHVEISGASTDADGRNFVLCPGEAYDRSPCGTGTSARLACLASDGLLGPGEPWRQEGVLGSSLTAWYEAQNDGTVVPTIEGRAYITADATLRFHEDDPFRLGIPSTAGRS